MIVQKTSHVKVTKIKNCMFGINIDWKKNTFFFLMRWRGTGVGMEKGYEGTGGFSYPRKTLVTCLYKINVRASEI